MNPVDLETVVKSMDARLRADARWHALPAEGKSWLVLALLGGTAYQVIRDEAQQRWGVKLSLTTLSDLHATATPLARGVEDTRQTRDQILARLTAAGRAADEMETLAGQVLAGLTRGAAATLGERTLSLLAQPELDGEALEPLLRAFVVAAGEARKQDALKLNRDKFEHLKAQAERAAQTEVVLDDARLTPEDRARRIAEIYGRGA